MRSVLGPFGVMIVEQTLPDQGKILKCQMFVETLAGHQDQEQVYGHLHPKM